ncbi:MAG TPA: dienelactone hydrolase family protein, partial [Methylomirabilota bacterium]|nr:dienelactone hydrolase family protein [Methylomirabilota bacterium]
MAGKMVDFPSNGHSAKGYLATPASGKGPGVLVIQEWWGLVGHIKNVCDRFAAAGFSALAPDLYHGQTATEPDAAGKLFMALNIQRAEKDLSGAAKFLAGHSSTAKLGAVGFCMGGQLALFAGCTNVNVGAVVDFYGIHPNVKPDYRKLNGPVLGLFAEKDLKGATAYLAQHSSTPKLGAVGFCMGGQLALFAATLNPAIGATVNFY